MATRYLSLSRNLKINIMYMVAKVIGIFGSLIWSKTLVGLIFKLFGEFR